MKQISNQANNANYLSVISWYLLFGIVHECFHFTVAFLLGVIHDGVSASASASASATPTSHRYLATIAWDILFYRQLTIPNTDSVWRIFLIRHMGWALSLILATILHIHFHYRWGRSRRCSSRDSDANCGMEKNEASGRLGMPMQMQWCLCAAYLTALEAIATDLCGFDQLSLSFFPRIPSIGMGKGNGISQYGSDEATFYCGNFGVILLGGAWFGNRCKAALDMLEKMIEVTMMRGAQSGGVVTFADKNNKETDDHDSATMPNMYGTRIRVVKGKRQDLSKILRSKITRASHAVASASKNVKFFAGHTRFATTSKATFDGTHPHQWSKPRSHRVYNMEELEWKPRHNLSASVSSGLSQNLGRLFAPHRAVRRKIAEPSNIRVENFITHNGDFEFYELNDRVYEIDTVQKFLEQATETPMPAVVDSAAIAGMIDLIRCKGCFGLSVRYAICLGMPTSQIPENAGAIHLPSYYQCEAVGKVFEEALREFQNENTYSLEFIRSSPDLRENLIERAIEKLNNDLQQVERSVMQPFNLFIGNEETGAGMSTFVRVTISSFFENDLLNTVKIFLSHAKGSFGLCVVSSLDSHRQICLAARGQTMSIAFYPKTNLILYGSEQAAVKAGMGVEPPGVNAGFGLDRSFLNVSNDVLRLDLDDVGGEICLLDWAGVQYSKSAISPCNRELKAHSIMQDQVNMYLLQESSTIDQPDSLHQRMTKLTRNPLITELKKDIQDPILQDIKDIPGACQAIQRDWRNTASNEEASMFSLNRLTAWNLGRCLKERLEQYASGALKPSSNRVDILLTGCEVSLWLAEQFAADCQKAFPKLRIVAMSSNKLLGLYGQDEINIPTIGFPISDKSLDLFDAITIIVSHSGGTFAPLGLSSLFQSKTNNIFVITSEWDTQIGKQLRSFNNEDGLSMKLLFNSRIFSTGVGMRPAEPCSISVVATHQLLTNIFEFIAIVVLSDDKYRNVTGAVITERDLQILERCNRDNLFALTEICGESTKTEKELRAAGDYWAEHILENAKAYIMTFIYIVGTVVSGYPVIGGVATKAGLSHTSRLVHFFRFLDALVYFFLPQINVIILRLIQRRPLLHRMGTRTVVIGDIPWVCNAAEAFLSKIFASSYSIAGLNVYSANPSDHLVHRMTHRVVRGTLMVCGRPDGRLSALTAMESAVCLSVNQASSIQSLGSTCESVTIGHNPFRLPLTARGIFLERNRPLFLCEHLLGEVDSNGLDALDSSSRRSLLHFNSIINAREDGPTSMFSNHRRRDDTLLDETLSRVRRIDDGERTNITTAPRRTRTKRTLLKKSSAALLGHYKTLEANTIRKVEHDHFLDKSLRIPLKAVLETAIHEKKWGDSARRLFEKLDVNKDTMLDLDEFVNGLLDLTTRSEPDLSTLFHQFDHHNEGVISFDQFYDLMTMNKLQLEETLQPSIRDVTGLIQVQPCTESFFGERLLRANETEDDHFLPVGATKSQNFAMTLYESRIGSLQRFISMTIMFHQMGLRVENFFSKMTFGFIGYRMDRTHSIMRIATTASPVSGADVRDRKQAIFYMRKIHHSVQIIESAWLSYKAKERLSYHNNRGADQL